MQTVQLVAVNGLNLTLYDATDTKCEGAGKLFVDWKDGDDTDLKACNSVGARGREGSVYGIAECYGPSEPLFTSGLFYTGMTFRLTRKNNTGLCDPWSDGIWYFSPAATQKLLDGECAELSDDKEKESYVRFTMPISWEKRPPCQGTTTSTFTTTSPPIISVGGVQKFLPFRPSGLSDAGRHECRGANRFDDAGSYYNLYGDGPRIEESVDTIEACEELCENTTGCTAIEHTSFGRCEVWTQPVCAVAEINPTGAFQGVLFDCYVYTPSLRDPEVCRDLPAEVVRMVSGGRYTSCIALLAEGGCPTANMTSDTNAIYCPASCDLCMLRPTEAPTAYEFADRTAPQIDISAAVEMEQRGLIRIFGAAALFLALSLS